LNDGPIPNPKVVRVAVRDLPPEPPKVAIRNFFIALYRVCGGGRARSDGLGADYCLLHTVSGLSSEMMTVAERITWSYQLK
jgi:hypothetical protein